MPSRQTPVGLPIRRSYLCSSRLFNSGRWNVTKPKPVVEEITLDAEPAEGDWESALSPSTPKEDAQFRKDLEDICQAERDAWREAQGIWLR